MKALGLGMHRKTKGIRVLCLLLLTLLMTGCLGVKDQLTAETVYTYETMQSEDKSKEFYIEQTAYYQDRVVITWGGTIDLSKFARMEPACELDGNTIVIFSDDPETVTTFTVMDKYEETQYHFRYLNSEAYAYLKRTMDSEGGIHFDGNPDRYYTAEEKAAQEEAKRKPTAGACWQESKKKVKSPLPWKAHGHHGPIITRRTNWSVMIQR